MKVEITRKGFIKVTAETITEAWALNGVWPIDSDPADREKNEDRLFIDCSILLEESNNND